jgi:hypothetical protein
LPGLLFLGSKSRLLLPAPAGFLLGLLFDFEDELICSLENDGLSSSYTALQPRILGNICLSAYYIKKEKLLERLLCP